MASLDYESSTTKTPRIPSPVFWVLLIFLTVATIILVPAIVYAGTEYGAQFVVVNLLLWPTPCVLGIVAMCIARFRRRSR
jgi:hypothetical protein